MGFQALHSAFHIQYQPSYLFSAKCIIKPDQGMNQVSTHSEQKFENNHDI
jgi:hypothetical protein